MLSRTSTTAALVAAFALSLSVPAFADGEILITQAKANAGNVTPGDAAGFPVTLSLAGSYILASNLQPPANKAGIRIASDDVTIDLNGFRLNGAAGATTGIYGAAFKSASIRNGTITGFGAHGIYTTGENWIVEDMRVVGNGAHGIHCGYKCRVEGSNSSENDAAGIAIYSGIALGNVIMSNTGFGIQASGNTGYGNNTLAENNGGGAQVSSVDALHPNFCNPACP